MQSNDTRRIRGCVMSEAVVFTNRGYQIQRQAFLKEKNIPFA